MATIGEVSQQARVMARYDYVFRLGSDELRFKKHRCEHCNQGVAKVSIYYDEKTGANSSTLHQKDVEGPLAAALWEMVGMYATQDRVRFGGLP